SGSASTFSNCSSRCSTRPRSTPSSATRARGRRPDRPPAPTDLLSHFLLAVVRFQLRPTAGRAQQSLAQLLGVGARHAHREARPLFVLGLELHVTAFEDPTNGPRIVVV